MRLVVAAFVFASLVSGSVATAATPSFKVLLRESGVYAVTFEDLTAAGWQGQPIPAADLGVDSLGQAVPIHVRGGEDGTFGPGDAIEFVGRHLRGERSWFAEETAWVVYWVRLGGGGLRYVEAPMQAAAEPCALEVRQHLEEDRLLLRFAPRLGDIEPWMWSRVSFFPQDQFQLPLELADLDRTSEDPVLIRGELRGWSTPRLPEGVPTHVVTAALDGAEPSRVEFQGQDLAELVLRRPAAELPEQVTFTLTSPRRIDEKDNPIVDVSLLNWLELRYPHDRSVRYAQRELFARSDEGCRSLALEVREAEQIVVFGATQRAEVAPLGQQVGVRFRAPEPAVWVVRDGAFHRPPVVELDRPSDLRSRSRQADYLMITHRSLRLETEQLADIPRRRGLSVEVVDVEEIFDEFSFGIVDPKAIRSFLQHSSTSWATPSPRFVLLVGDASWDARNEELDDQRYADMTWAANERRAFNKIPATPHPRRPTLGHRNLIPTYRWASSDGHAASDHYFVDFDEDGSPEMAIGRLPVSEPDEVRGIVSKIRGYLAGPPVGPWRRHVLWLVNEEAGFQRQTDNLAGAMAGLGLGGSKIYPKPEEASNELHQGAIREAIDEGQLLVHFVGHGGRFIWRTGPPDPRKNHDLFTLDDLDALEPNDKLPVILSMTCYSAPFDHPTADSIGERFLRLPGRGAIAVFGASWRYSPSQRVSERLMTGLLEEDSLGEALRVTKAEFSRSKAFVMMFNLIGDPALPLARPTDALVPALLAEEVQVELPWQEAGTRVLFEAFDARGNVLAREELEDPSPVAWRLPAGIVADRVGVYAWNEALRRDAVGGLELPDPTAETVAELAPKENP
jgi:hypothetical protein